MGSVMIEAKIHKIDDSLMLPLSPALLESLELDAKEGDTLYLAPIGNGELKMRMEDPEMQALVAAEQAVIDRNHDILAALA